MGGNSIVPMAKLKICFEELGFESVRTYINSGNVVFRAVKTPNKRLEAKIGAAITKTFDLNVMVLVRTQAEMEQLLKSLPSSWQNPEGLRFNMIFLHSDVDDSKVLDQLEVKPEVEEIHYRPGCVLWSAYTSNITKSKVKKVIGTSLYKQMTIRTLNTIKKLESIMQQTV